MNVFAALEHIWISNRETKSIVVSEHVWCNVCMCVIFVDFSSKACIPHLKNGKNPHILNISPPLNMNPVWFKDHVGKLALNELTVAFIVTINW